MLKHLTTWEMSSLSQFWSDRWKCGFGVSWHRFKARCHDFKAVWPLSSSPTQASSSASVNRRWVPNPSLRAVRRMTEMVFVNSFAKSVPDISGPVDASDCLFMGYRYCAGFEVLKFCREYHAVQRFHYNRNWVTPSYLCQRGASSLTLQSTVINSFLFNLSRDFH